jgi:hypothetical protein
MPRIPLDVNPSLIWTRIWSVMHYPREDQEGDRRSFENAIHVRELAQLSERLESKLRGDNSRVDLDLEYKARLMVFFRDGGFPSLWLSDAPFKTIENARLSEMRGRSAGVILLALLSMAKRKRSDHPAHVRRAIHLVSESWKQKPQEIDGRRVASSQRALYSAWSQFSTVAHMWAATRIHSGSEEADEYPVGHRALHQLALSEAIANSAIQLGVPWDAKLRWEFELPFRLPKAEFEPPGMSDAKLRITARKYQRHPR